MELLEKEKETLSLSLSLSLSPLQKEVSSGLEESVRDGERKRERQ